MSSTDRDTAKRYLVPVGALGLPDEPNDTHLAVMAWQPRLEAWLTGQGICGQSTAQGGLTASTEVTCAGCLRWQDIYETILADNPTAPQGAHASDLYFCPASSEVESHVHGGFDVCCGRPELHIQLPAGPVMDALSHALSQAARDRYAVQVLADDAWGSVWLHGNWPRLTKCMTTPEREYAADCVARWSARLAKEDNDPDRAEPEGLRWWRG